MLFHSPEFVVLMLLTLAIYVMAPKVRIPLLAVANLFFYGVSGWQYLLLFMGVLALTHLSALRVHGPHGKVWLWFGVLVNLANLFTFKYTAFVVSNLDRLWHLGLDPARWQLVLPVGISFYTFHLIAYLVDVYRKEIPPARSLVECWVFTAFFGQLIAGPIMRGAQFLPQIQQVAQKKLRWEEFRYGAFLFLLGMAKKVLLSDLISPKVENFFTNWHGLTGLDAWVAGWLFAFQIYFDFSAYSEMALGIGHMFGFELMTNFRTPYLAHNPSEFWRRWHISLSTWIRDYLYIPLGGSRRGEMRTYFNLIAAMAISGLWHGAAWTFVIWGLYHGVLQALHKLWSKLVVKRLNWQPRGWVVRWAAVFLMFQATTIGWIFFRAGTLQTALTLVQRMFTPTALRLTPLATRYLPVIAVLALLHVAEFWLREKEASLGTLWAKITSPLRAAVLAVVVVVLIVMTATEQSSFIYFQF